MEEKREEKKEDEKKGKGEEKKEAELSADDQALLEGLELAVERVNEDDVGVQSNALQHLVNEVRTATASMTSVPKPLKFLRPHYDNLKSRHETMTDESNRRALADLLAVLAMTMAKPGAREVLSFKKAGNRDDLGSWGHEFVRSLAGEIGQEYTQRVVSSPDEESAAEPVDVQDLMELVDDIVPFHLKHNAEAEAIDLLMEVQQLGKLVDLSQKGLINEHNYQRICLYLMRCTAYMADPDDLRELFESAFSLYRSQKQFPEALRVALNMHDSPFQERRQQTSSDSAAMDDEDEEEDSAYDARIRALFNEAPDLATRQQMAFVLARHGLQKFEYPADEEVNAILGNNSLRRYFGELAVDLDVVDPKTPEDIYKSHLGDSLSSRGGNNAPPQRADSARANLASTLVNSFVNAGFGADLLMTPEGNSWLYKNKEHGMLSAAASLGMIMMWDVEEGLTKIDKFLYSSDENVKAGACLAIGIVSANVRHESDPPIALLPEHLADDAPKQMRLASATALGIAYAGCAREDAVEVLSPIVSGSASVAEASLAALSLGEIFVGTCDQEVASVIVQRLMESSDADLDEPVSRFLCLGLALVFLGRMDKADATLEALKTIEHDAGLYARVSLEACAYCGTGNVLKIQRMLHVCAERQSATTTTTPENGAGGAPSTAGGETTTAKAGGAGAPLAPASEQPQQASASPAPAPASSESPSKEAAHQSVAVLGIALVTAGEDVGAEMALRTFDHLLHYGEPAVRRAVPLALALMKVSNPEYAVVDTMSRLTHDADQDVAQAAIVGLGILGAGTNNSRVAGLLRQLAEHSRDPSHLFVVRIAQGLLHMGKGLISISPFHSDRSLVSRPAMAGLLAFLHACLDMKHTLLDNLHYLIYHLAIPMYPRLLFTVDENLDMLPVSVRVGQAVETVGQAGRPKTITGFQTHTTPVLMGVGDRAELAAPDEFTTFSKTLEGVVILRKNPEAEATAELDDDAATTAPESAPAQD